MKRIPFTGSASRVQACRMLQTFSRFNSSAWNGFPPSGVFMSALAWDAKTGNVAGVLEVGRDRYFLGPGRYDLFWEADFAVLGDVELGEPLELSRPWRRLGQL